MNLNDMLSLNKIDKQQVLVFRHRPHEPDLNHWLPWLAANKPKVFNAYQQTQGEKLEKAMAGAKYVASFIGREPGKALFVGLYEIGKSKSMTRKQYWQVPEHEELKKDYGMKGWTEDEDRDSVLWFDLELMTFYDAWRGKLIVRWPPPERSWWRRAPNNDMPVLAILEESALDLKMPDWKEISLTREQITRLPPSWRHSLKEWRGIYYIFDISDSKGYVGSAYGTENLLGRWQGYAASGHGGNKLLRERSPSDFRFTILQLVSPDMDQDQVTKLEGTWKERLHTRQPYGLNDN